jgi:hypothetical protein
MRRLETIILCVFLLAATSGVKAFTPDEAMPGHRGETNRFFVFKTDRKYIGATLEVYHGNGERLVVQKLEKRKVSIDFGKVRTGEYTIRIQKNNDIQEFRYVKK